MYGLGDWFIISLQTRNYALNPAVIYATPYTIAGCFGEPLLILSIAMVTASLYGSWLKFHQPIAWKLDESTLEATPQKRRTSRTGQKVYVISLINPLQMLERTEATLGKGVQVKLV